MKNKLFENILVALIIIFLSAHLFTVHSKLLFHINPDKLVKKLEYYFNTTLFSQELIVSTIGAIAYSLITALILTIFVKYRKVFIFTVGTLAALDALGVFVYYNVTLAEKTFLITGSVYYAIYTAAIIISLGLFRYLSYKDSELNENIDKAIKETDIMNIREIIQDVFKENIHEYSNYTDYFKKAHKAGQQLNKEFMTAMSKGLESEMEKTEKELVLDEKILHLSRVKHKTQVEIAQELGISQPQVSRVLAKYKTSG